MRSTGYATGPVTKAPAWHGLVALDMLWNGMTTGLFLVAAVSELVAPDVFGAVAKAAHPVALVLLLVDLVCLVLDLGDPLRFHHMLRVWKPGSPMSVGTWCLSVYALPLTVAATEYVKGGNLVEPFSRTRMEKATRQATLRCYRLPRTDVSLKMVELRGLELEGYSVSATEDELLALPPSGRGRR